MNRITVLYEVSERTPFDAIRIEVEEAATQVRFSDGSRNSQRTGGTIFEISAYSNTRRSGFGVHARGVAVGWTGDPPAGYSRDGLLFIPIFRPFRFDRISAGQTLTYRDTEAIIVSKRPEILR